MAEVESHSSAKSILLVEDNPNDVALTLRAFQRSGLAEHVGVVRDGAEALDYLFGTGDYAGVGPDLPQLVLLDLHLPRLNGLEVLDRIRSDPRTRFVPVVAFTSSTAERDLTASYLGGANSCVRKPEEFAELAELLRQIWHYWSAVNQLPPARTDPAPQAAFA
jgi:two-component system response regulator